MPSRTLHVPARFVVNPAYGPKLLAATVSALNDVGNDVAEVAAKVATPYSSRVSKNIVNEGVRPDKNGSPFVTIRFNPRSPGYVGNFMEGGTKERFTRGGAYRGRMPVTPMLAPARDAVLRLGLPVWKYLR